MYCSLVLSRFKMMIRIVLNLGKSKETPLALVFVNFGSSTFEMCNKSPVHFAIHLIKV